MNNYALSLESDILVLGVNENDEYRDLRYFHKDYGWLFAAPPSIDFNRNIIVKFESEEDIDTISYNITKDYPEVFL